MKFNEIFKYENIGKKYKVYWEDRFYGGIVQIDKTSWGLIIIPIKNSMNEGINELFSKNTPIYNILNAKYVEIK